jgi:hypothetical protein
VCLKTFNCCTESNCITLMAWCKIGFLECLAICFHDCFGFHAVFIRAGLMHSRAYFSNLISSECTLPGNYSVGQSENMEMPVEEGVGQPDDTIASNELPTQDDLHDAAKEKKRSKNFNIDEDKLQVSAWLNVSQDPIQGVNQAHNTYWGRIHQYFHAKKFFDSDRSQVSLMNRWCDIQHDVNVFCGCLSRIEARNQSDASVDDKVYQHSSIYLFRKHVLCIKISNILLEFTDCECLCTIYK